MTRRSFLALTALVPLAAVAPPNDKQGFLFRVRGRSGVMGIGDKLAFMYTDGTGLRIYDFGRPNQINWYPSAIFKDGRRAMLMSIEMDKDWKTEEFEKYYHKSRTHVWICDLETGALTEIAQKDRLAPFYGPCALLPGEEHMLVDIDIDGRNQLFSMDLDGSHAKRITAPDEFVYGVSVSPDGARIAFHADYRIFVSLIDGAKRTLVAGRKGYIYFGTSWSPDGQWVLFQVCEPASDPGHDWSDIWIGRPDGSENRALTQGKSAWFAASYGKPDNPGSGSNQPRWAPDGSGIVYARRLPNSKTPWEHQTQRPNTDHFGRDFKPESARGGTRLSFLNPNDGSDTALTSQDPPVWEFRADWSPDSRRILFCRAGTGENPAIWIMDRDGANQRRLSDGADGQGAEFPRFLG